MGRAVETSEQQRAAFAEALRSYLARADMRQADLHRHLIEDGFKVEQSQMSKWANAINEPPREVVVAMEEHLELVPGLLSRHLGWLPLSAVPTSDVESALLADPYLTADQRQVLLSTYRALRGI